MEKKEGIRTKEELEKIAEEILEQMKTKDLKIWQVKEVLTIAKELIGWTKFK